MAQYTLKNGKILVVTSDSCQGMAGEPMNFLIFELDNKNISFESIEDQLEENDKIELKEQIQGYDENNESNAIAWTI